MSEPHEPDEDSVPNAATLLLRTKALQSHFLEADYVRLLEDLTSHLQTSIDFYHKVLVDHIAAAKSLADGDPAGDDGRSKTGFGRYPKWLLLALRPLRGLSTDLLPHGHHLGLALILLGHTKSGCEFLAEQTGLQKRTIQFATVRLFRWARELAGPGEILQSVSALLESHLPTIGLIRPELEGTMLRIAHRKICLGNKQAVVMALLLRDEPVSHGDFKDKGINFPVESVSRLKKKLRNEGVELQVDSSRFERYMLQGAVFVPRPLLS